MSSRFQRRHERLLRDYLEATRELEEAEENGASRNAIERLKVRERSLVGSIRRVRIELGLPADFDADTEFARLRSQERKSIRARRTDELGWSERPRVQPVPQKSNRHRNSDRPIDLAADLVAHAARFCARRAAEELLEHRQSPARGHARNDAAAWLQRDLARTANGEIYAGSAGRLMGELVARARDSDHDASQARIAILAYVNEFAAWVTAALRRERDVVERLIGPTQGARTAIADVRNDLIRAAYSRIAVEARAVSNRDIDSDDVAATAGLPADHASAALPETEP